MHRDTAFPVFTRATFAGASLVAVLLATDARARVTFESPEIVVNTHTTNWQFRPRVARTGEDEFVVVWTSLFQEDRLDGYAGVYAQRFASDGAARGTEFQVNSYATHSQFYPEVASNASGEFVVAWTSFRQFEGYYSVVGQHFAAEGVPLQTEFRASETEASTWAKTIALAPSGDALVVWRGFSDAFHSHEIFGRLVSRGVPVRGEFQINTYTPNKHSAPDACSTPDGGFVVVWESGLTFEDTTAQDGLGPGIFGQRLTASAEPSGTEFQVNTYTPYSQYGADVTCLEDGRFVVVWSGMAPESRWGAISMRTYDASGAPEGDQFQVTEGDYMDPNPYDFAATPREIVVPPPIQARIAPRGDGGFFIVSVDPHFVYGGGFGATNIVGQVVAADGSRVGGQVPLNEGSFYNDFPDVVATGPVEFQVVWSGSRTDADPPQDPDGSGSAVFLRRITIAAGPACGDPDDDGDIEITDALTALRTAVGAGDCDSCVCDVNASGAVTGSDALILLNVAIGRVSPLSCSSCPPDS
jgi:hypothetical protein